MSELPRTLEEIDPNAYPCPVADWRDVGAYPDHGSDALMWAWEFARRDGVFQFCSDCFVALVAIRNDEINVISAPEVVLEIFRKSDYWGLVAELRDRLRTASLGAGSPPDEWPWRDGSATHLSMLVEKVTSKIYGPFMHPGYQHRNGHWTQAMPLVNKNNIVMSACRPPWPLEWPGIDEETSRYTATDFLLSGVPKGCGTLFRPLLPEGGVDTPLNVGSLLNHVKRLGCPPEKPSSKTKAVIAFDLSANIGAQLERAREMLEGMQHRASFNEPERAMPVPTAKKGRRILRYLDWQAEGNCDQRGAHAAFKESIGIGKNDPKAWRRLREQVDKYTADPTVLVQLR